MFLFTTNSRNNVKVNLNYIEVYCRILSLTQRLVYQGGREQYQSRHTNISEEEDGLRPRENDLKKWFCQIFPGPSLQTIQALVHLLCQYISIQEHSFNHHEVEKPFLWNLLLLFVMIKHRWHQSFWLLTLTVMQFKTNNTKMHRLLVL